jgi:GDP-mannose 6-dehydrogenase
MSDPGSPTRVAVFGLGYVGCVTAACLADLGHQVLGVDRDEFKVRSVLEGRAPFYEPDLQELVRANVSAGRLEATTSTAEALRSAEVVLICVGTPSERNGNLGLSQLERVVEEIALALDQHPSPLVVAVRSTVFPGTCEDVVIPRLRRHPDVAVVSNPEFLREGAAVRDFREPSLVVVGGEDLAAVTRVAGLYARLCAEPCIVSLRTAEMIKYACNAFHAVKISFANEIGSLAQRMGVASDEVMSTLCRDMRLNISTAYLKPGFAFGGSCLPKDLRALAYRAGRLDLKLPLLESTLPSNERHLHRAIETVLDLPGDRLGILGLAFKENTDDLRESPVVTMVEHLIGKGRDVRIWDPQIRLEGIYGTNKAYVLRAIPHVGRLMVSSLEELLGWAQNVVVTQKLTAETSRLLASAGLPVLDLAAGGASASKAAG